MEDIPNDATLVEDIGEYYVGLDGDKLQCYMCPWIIGNYGEPDANRRRMIKHLNLAHKIYQLPKEGAQED